MPISAVRDASRRRPLPRSGTVAAVLGVALAGGCGRPATTPTTRLPVLRPAQIIASVPPSAGPGREAALSSAGQVVRGYFDALDGLRHGMRVAPLARVLTADCPCRAQVRAVRAARRRGDRYTDRVRVTSLVAHLDRADLVDVVVSLDISRAGLMDASGHRRTPVTTLRNLHRELLLRRIDDHWLISRVIAV